MIEIKLLEEEPAEIELLEDEPLEIEIDSELVQFSDYEEYEGKYVVVPDTTQQVLITADKHTSKDITVKEIPYAEVSNSAGGKTATIG